MTELQVCMEFMIPLRGSELKPDGEIISQLKNNFNEKIVFNQIDREFN